MPEHLAPTWLAWRLVVEKVVMIDGLERMTLDDALEANDALDFWYDAQQKAARQ